ncbi:hypothetical protein LXA43DRAFT_1100662 [Ganoderma leucocontextum]|nr:hypothetical protein LXA43DRAFT_1100662 [Ganoderma leucocontextum]
MREKCPCCGKYLSKRQIIRHRKGQAPPHLNATQALHRLTLRKVASINRARSQSRLEQSAGDMSGTESSEREGDSLAADEEEADGQGFESGCSDFENGMVWEDSVGVQPDDFEGSDSGGYSIKAKEELITRIEKVAASMRRAYPVTVEDYDSDSEMDVDDADSDDYEDDLTSEAEDEWDEDDTYNPELSARVRLQATFMKEVAILEKRLSEADRQLLRIFTYQVKHKLTEDALAEIPAMFGIEKLPSFQRIRARVAFLASVIPEKYDCCINSCQAYTGSDAELTSCPYCKEPRYDAYNAPRRQFTYLPFIHRLVAMHANETRAEEMDYRSEFKPDEEIIQDVFDSEHYCNLRSRDVTIDGQNVGHKFFSDH